VDDFTGLTALVTGGASGIGAATAALLSRRGAHVAVMDRSTENVAADHLAIRGDVTEDEEVHAAVSRTVATFGRLDILVNNAGTGAQGGVADNSPSEWWSVLDTNVLGVMRMTRAALPHLEQSPHAAVVIVSSIVASVGVHRRVLYAASKGAVLSMTLAMAADFLPSGIRANCVAPGTADTPWVERLLSVSPDAAEERARLEARQPMGRLVSAEEVAHAVVYLASPASASTTGTVLYVDGGMQTLRV
jgi:2-keto-3-deoxy-L-fuconate dehydrogenase